MLVSALSTVSLAVTVLAAPATPWTYKRSPSYACDVLQISQPAAPTILPAPSGSLILVALGKGTQNYECASGNSSAAPTAVGATATLYNASCLAVESQAYLNMITRWADTATPGALSEFGIAGHHFFVNSTTPSFNITNMGTTETKKVATSNAPNNVTDAPWLFLEETATNSPADMIRSVYRLETTRGVAPNSCASMAAGPFTVPYSAQYWFYS